jgi:hypothetical protein
MFSHFRYRRVSRSFRHRRTERQRAQNSAACGDKLSGRLAGHRPGKVRFITLWFRQTGREIVYGGQTIALKPTGWIEAAAKHR